MILLIFLAKVKMRMILPVSVIPYQMTLTNKVMMTNPSFVVFFNKNPCTLKLNTGRCWLVQLKIRDSNYQYMYLQNLLKKYPWTFSPQTLTFITCLSKCRIGDVFKHFFLLFLYLFRMNEQGGGQMTCYWYVLISLKFLSIVCF